MTIEKEIRAVGLYLFEKDEERLAELLTMLEMTQPQVHIRYNRNNPKDKTCMEFVLGIKPFAYVNVDEKRYVEPLMRETGMCTANFFEVYRRDGHAPVVRFLITVDLDDVMPLEPGKEWEKWEYSFPVIPLLEEFSTVTYAADMLKDMLTKNLPEEYTTKEELIKSFVDASMFDMSVDTSKKYDDILFYLETSRRRIPEYIDTLQWGCTVRRTDKIRNKFLLEWWPRLLEGEISKRLCKSFAIEMAKKYGSVSEDIVKEEYGRLNAELIKLPYGLYADINDIKEFWAGMFYTKIPRKKFLEVLSALILYNKLTETVKNKKPFIIEQMNFHIHGGTFVQKQTINS